jgi:hypothetical protein
MVSEQTRVRQSLKRGVLTAAVLALAIAGGAAQAQPKTAPARPKVSSSKAARVASASERMQEPGAEAKQLARRAGVWTVVNTIRATPDAKPAVTAGLVAERKMIGLYLEEVMMPAPGSATPEFRRISYLTYSRVEGRWQYVSLDTRLPVGIMPAWSFDKGTDKKLTLEFEPLAFAGFGPHVQGRMIRSNFVITRESDDRELAQQYWSQADGSERTWLAVQYEYTRKPAAPPMPAKPAGGK